MKKQTTPAPKLRVAHHYLARIPNPLWGRMVDRGYKESTTINAILIQAVKEYLRPATKQRNA